MAAYNSINLFDILPNTIWTDIYKQKYTYNNLEDLYNLNSDTRDSLLYMIKFGYLKLFYGIVYASGVGEEGQLGNGITYDIKDYPYEGTPIPIDTVYMNSKRVIQVSAGVSHSLFLCEDGSVYASGNGRGGRLGDGRTDGHDEGTPIPIDTSNMEGKRVIQFDADYSHSLFLCEDGSVFASGEGNNGILGDGRTYEHYEGTPIPIDTSNMNGKVVIQVSAGEFHSLFLCEDGSVYASGDGEYGKLGDGRTDNHDEGTPIPIDISNIEGKRVIQVSAGMNHSLFLCEDGTVFSSGGGYLGRLGDGRTDYHDEGTPIPIDISNIEGKRVIQVSASYLHSLFLCEDGTVFASGNGTSGQLGDGRKNDHNEGTPIPIDTANMNGKSVVQVSAGYKHSLFLCEDGSVYASGRGDFGELGDGEIDYDATDEHYKGTPIPIDTTNMNRKRVIQVSANKRHSLFLT